MSRTSIAIAFLAAATVGSARELTSKDLIGAWTLGVAHKDYAYYTFWSDHRYRGDQGDMIFEGRWKLSGQKITFSGSRSDAVTVEGFSGDTLRVTLSDGKKDTWKKMPRWRGSPKY
jgi:hypothetical protein